MSARPGAWPLRVAVVCAVQALLVAGAVWPQLSARLTGQEVLLAVAPVDPVDPFRGAYVRLAYPGLPQPGGASLPEGPPVPEETSVPEGTVFVPLEPTGGGLWEGGPLLTRAPDDGPYLRCESDGWQLRCGIESLFLPQDEALQMERELAEGAVARVRVDDRGSAALLGVEPGA